MQSMITGGVQDAAADKLTWEFIEDGMVSRRQLAKQIINLNGVWLTIVYLYQDLNRRTGLFTDPRIAFVRYRRYKDGFKKMGQFNLGLDQLAMLSPVLSQWVVDGPALARELADLADEQAYAPSASAAPVSPAISASALASAEPAS